MTKKQRHDRNVWTPGADDLEKVLGAAFRALTRRIQIDKDGPTLNEDIIIEACKKLDIKPIRNVFDELHDIIKRL